MSMLVQQVDGKLMVSLGNYDDLVCCGEGKRSLHQLVCHYVHFLQPSERRSWIVMRNPFFYQPVGVDDEYPGESINYREIDFDSSPCRYIGTVIMLISGFNCSSPRAYILNTDGDILGGANIYPDGYLCLGDQYETTGIEPLEMFLFNDANGDLPYRGSRFEGDWLQLDDSEKCYLEVTRWPSYKPQEIQIPRALIDVALHWSPI